MQALITGASGFIGRNLYTRLLQEDKIKSIVCVSRTKNPDFIGYPLKQVQVIRCDLSDEEDVIKLFSKCSPNIIFHLAANPLPQLNEKNPSQILRDNVIGTQHICHYCPSEIQLIFTSSITVYGSITNGYIPDEESPCVPLSVYAATKIAAEKIIDAYRIQNGIKPYYLRLGATIGKYMTHGLVYDIMRKLKSPTQYLELFGDEPGTSKVYTHVDDVISAMMTFMKYPLTYTHYNICNSDVLTVLDVAKIVMRVSNIHKPIKWLGNNSIWRGDNMLLRARSKYIIPYWERKYINSTKSVEQATYDIIST